jgi:hypothetical protein
MSFINEKNHHQTLMPPVIHLWIFAFLFIIGYQIVLTQASWAQNDTILFQDDFEDGATDWWVLSPGWNIALDDGNRVLCYSGFPEFEMRSSAYPNVSGWVNFTLELKLKIMKGNLHIDFRSNPGAKYWLGIPEGGGCYLAIGRNDNGSPWNQQIIFSQEIWELSKWYSVKIILNGAHIQIYRDNKLIIDYTDNTDHAILTPGGFAFETFFNMIPGRLVKQYFDDIKVTLID